MSSLVTITGGTGFIGRCAVDVFNNAGYRVRILSRQSSSDLADVDFRTVDWKSKESVRKAIKGTDVVIHAAAPHPGRTSSNMTGIIDETVGITQTLIESLDDVKRFIFMSSMWGVVNSNSLDGHFDENTPYGFENNASPYGYGKHLAEELCLKHFREHGLPVVTCNPCVVIGPNDLGPSPNGREILNYLKRTYNFVVDTNFSFVDVRDVVAALLLLSERGAVGEKYVLCGANWPMKDYVGEILKAGGRDAKVYTIPMPLASAIAYACEIVKACIPSIQVPVVSSSIKFAKLRPVFDGSKISRTLGLKYTDPHQTIHDAVAWLNSN